MDQRVEPITPKYTPAVKRRRGHYAFAGFRFFPSSHELYRNGHKIPLKVQCAKILGILLQANGKLVSREAIIQKIWSDRIVEFDLSLNTCIREIRHALSDNARKGTYIETLAKRGYRFKGNTKWVEAKTLKKRSLKFLGWAAAPVAAAALVFYLNQGIEEHPSNPPTEVAEDAKALVLQGVSAIYDQDVADIQAAIGFFQDAIAVDPGYTEAHLMLARTVIVRGDLSQIPLAEEAIDRLLEIDPTNTEALGLKGSIRWAIYHDYDGAKALYEQALEVDANFNQAYIFLAGYYSVMGDFDESLRNLGLALNRNTIRLTEAGTPGWFYYLAGRHEEGLRFCDQTFEINPDGEKTQRCYLNNLILEAEQGRAAAHALALLKLLEMPAAEISQLEALGPTAVLSAFNRNEAGRTVPKQNRTNTAFLMKAGALTRMGNHDEAVAVLEGAFLEKNYFLPFIRVMPDLAPLQQHPDFIALLSAMRLPPTRS